MQSDTWALATPELRPWLLMLWTIAWQQNPCGSMPSDDALLTARLGMTPKAFQKAKAILLRGWWLADDGRLYHDTIVERVLEMLDYKSKEKQRKAAYRDKMSANVPRDKQGTDTGQTRDSSGNDATGTGTGTGTSISSVPNGTGGKPPLTDPDEIIFGYGLPMLVNAGAAEKHARSFLGGLRKRCGDAALIDKLRECVKAKPLQPLEWLAAALPLAETKPGTGKHAGFKNINYREGVEADGTFV